VDDAGALLGIVTLDDLLKLHVEEAGLLQQVIAKEQTHESRAKR
jgi:hypothetical protein